MSADGKRVVAGVIALGVTVLFAALGHHANERSKLVMLAGGRMAVVPVDDAMLQKQERFLGPGGAFSGNAAAEGHLEAMRAANRAYKMRGLYFVGSVVAGSLAVWLLIMPWLRARRRPDP